MKRRLLAIIATASIAATLVLLLSSCGAQQNELVGIWKVDLANSQAASDVEEGSAQVLADSDGGLFLDFQEHGMLKMTVSAFGVLHDEVPGSWEMENGQVKVRFASGSLGNTSGCIENGALTLNDSNGAKATLTKTSESELDEYRAKGHKTLTAQAKPE